MHIIFLQHTSKIFKHLFALIVFCLMFFYALISAQAHDRSEGFADIVESLLPAVVNIRALHKQSGIDVPEDFMLQIPKGSPFRDLFKLPNEENKGPSTALGSGFVIDEEGHIVTNYHVVDGASEIEILFSNKRSYTAKLVGQDLKLDLALLKILPNEDETLEDFAYVEFASSDNLRIGDWVIAIGNPLGFGGTVTTGIVSARGRDIQAGPYDDFIQTDAPINRGNSGGPLFNLDGKVVGVNTAIISTTGGSIGLGFAIPSTQAMQTIKQLKQFGKTRRGWLGVTIQPVTKEVAESLGMVRAYGALIAGIHPSGPAAKSGLQTGDVIIKFNGEEVPSSRKLPFMVANTAISNKAEVVVRRNGVMETFNIVLGELESADFNQQSALASNNREDANNKKNAGMLIKELGIHVAEITARLATRYGLDNNARGLVIIKTDDKNDEKPNKLQPGTMIVEINQIKVEAIDDLKEPILKAIKDKRKRVLLLLRDAAGIEFFTTRKLR